MTDSDHLNKAKALDALFAGYEGPAFAIRLWTGWSWTPSVNERPLCTIVLENPGALAEFVSHPDEITLGEAFVRGDLDVEGDIFAVFAVAEHLFDRPHGLRQQVTEKLPARIFSLRQWLRHGPAHSEGRARASIAYHYDQPLAFFEPWLGPSLVYSCGYFRSAQDTLEEAQRQKLDLICQKLRLKPRERFLDIGCGWGSLLLHAVGRRQVHGEGITLSREQASITRRRIAQDGLIHRCSAELCDYRELPRTQKQFDKIASIGMFEHVGLKDMQKYFGTAYNLLRPGGLFLNHGIARAHTSPARDRSFIDRYVFPDGRLVTLSEALQAAESQGLEVRDVENLREHYELTLRHWVDGLLRNRSTLLEYVPLTTYRIWQLYMAGSAAAFHRGDIGVYQVLFSRPDHGESRTPLTREDWYAGTARQKEEEQELQAF